MTFSIKSGVSDCDQVSKASVCNSDADTVGVPTLWEFGSSQPPPERFNNRRVGNETQKSTFLLRGKTPNVGGNDEHSLNIQVNSSILRKKQKVVTLNELD